MDSNHVSAVVPCFNVAPWIKRCLESLFSQTAPPFEVICVDDGSTDETLQIVERIRKQHSNLVRVVTGERRGAAAARNRGMQMARGSWIQFLDADDYLFADKLARDFAIVAQPNVPPDLVCGAFVRRYEDHDGEQPVVPARGDEWVALILGGGELGMTSPNLWRRNLLTAVGGWDESLRSSQEYDLMFRMLKHGGRLVRNYVPMTVKTERTSGIWGSLWKKEVDTASLVDNFLVFLELRQRIGHWLEENGLWTEDRRRALFFVAHLIAKWVVYPHDRRRAIDIHRAIIPDSFSYRGVKPIDDLLGHAQMDMWHPPPKSWPLSSVFSSTVGAE